MINIPLIKPYINDEIKKAVYDVLESGYLTEGPITKEFETVFKEYIGCNYAIAVTSCTTGLEIALRALEIGPGDEVIVPDYTYPATAAVISIVGAKAVIVDIEKESMLISCQQIERAITKNTKAIMPVSIFGNPLDYSKLNKIKEKYGLFIIEDAACSIGAEYSGIRVGNQADISVFSLHPRKFITTGEGGMITTNNTLWANWMNSYKHFGMDMNNSSRSGIQFDIIGTNYKLSNVLSAIGLGQMQIINDLLTKRIELAKNYTKLLIDQDNIILPSTIENGKHSYQSFCIYVENRDYIIEMMRKKGIEVQIGSYALHMHKAFRNNANIKLIGEYVNSKYAFDHCLVLPLFHTLSFNDQDFIIDCLTRIPG